MFNHSMQKHSHPCFKILFMFASLMMSIKFLVYSRRTAYALEEIAYELSSEKDASTESN